MIDKNYIDEQEAPFLNRFEKAIVKFEMLLNEKQKLEAKNIYQKLKIKEYISKLKLNYNIENLLINCDKKSIDRLYFYYSNKDPNLKELDLEKIIFEKIARTLPQDVILNLEDNHPIKLYYNQKNIFNFKDYLDYLKGLSNEKKNNFKFSIIYTFSSIISNIEGISDQMISEIKREKNLIELVNEKRFKNKKGDNYFIMHFYQHELDKINFIKTTLKNNFEKEEIKFIFIVHLQRTTDKKKKKKYIQFLI